jgi:ubiquinone/menaquinone biosynthesis C-methylase UbiE
MIRWSAGLFLFIPATVWAHANLIRSVPANRAVLFQSPPALQLWFSERIEPRYLEILESQRTQWWSDANFETWKNLYVSEYARGYYVVDLLSTYVPGFSVAGSRVLDIGCGDAGVIIAFAEAGANVVGIEVDERSIHRGRLRAEEHGVSATLLEGAAESLAFPDESFDLVILDNVLEHVQDRERTLSEIHRVLRPGGLLYMVTPKPFALYSLWNDPHYDLAGLVLMPRRLQIWYFERFRGAGAGAYDVGVIPTRWRLRRMLRESGFVTRVPPRELWIYYLRSRISRPDEVRPGIKRRLARWLNTAEFPFTNPIARWFWDVSLGSNFFLAQKRG